MEAINTSQTTQPANQSHTQLSHTQCYFNDENKTGIKTFGTKKTNLMKQSRSWDFRQIYTFGAVGDKDELIKFWGQKIKGQGHDKTKCGQKCISPAKAYRSTI